MAEWIPVTERLPELDQEVLVYAVGKIDGFIGDSVYALTERVLFKFFPSSEGTEEWRSPWQYFMEDYEITHWMPLPEPPMDNEYEAYQDEMGGVVEAIALEMESYNG